MVSTEYFFKVKWGDTDAAGIVFFPNFYKWMDEASHDLFGKLGYSTWKLYNEEQISILLLEAKCEFKSPLLFEDEVSLISTISEIHDKVIKIEHNFYKKGNIVASGYTLRAWTDFSGPKPKAVSIPEDVRKAMNL